MSKTIKLTTKSFISKAMAIHGCTYDYSKVDYKNSKTKVAIICPKHGRFMQRASNHLSGIGCRLCGINKSSNCSKYNTKLFIKKAMKVHGNRYDYSKVDYKNSRLKVTIICPEHGEFEQLPTAHLSGQGCRECGLEKLGKKFTQEQFITKSKLVHNNKYSYTKTKYKDARTKVTIICPKHGEFEQTAGKHMTGSGCVKCGNKKRHKSTTNKFIESATKVHGNRYDYSKVDYKNSRLKVTIICPEHG